MIHKIRRWNKFWIGLTLSMILPIVVFLVVYLIGYSKTPFWEFLEYAFVMRALPKILSLCVIPNLAIFYLFLNKEYWYATRGVITATLLCTLAVVAIKFIPGF
jgi:hypothetical protein